LATLAVAAAEKIIQRNLDPSMHYDLLNQLTADI
jgi:F0F1-type ATP synthase membrane subunit b/b'